MQSKKNIFLWCSYDFANSLVQIVFFLYFAQWIVIDRGIADIHFNLAFTLSALLLLLTAPFVGSLLDGHLRRISGLRYSSLAVAVLYGLCAVFALNGQNIESLICFGLGLYSYLLTFTFYTPLIRDITSPETRGRISGLGILAHYTGQFFGLLLALPFSLGVLSLFGGDVRAETLLPAVIAFAVFALPMLLWFRELATAKEASPISLHTGFKKVLQETKQLVVLPGMAAFLIAYFLLNDAILTASNNFPIYLSQVWGISDAVKTYILLGIIITSGIGGLFSGILADRFGHKRTLLYVTAGWLVIFPLMAMVESLVLFVVVTTIMGFWFGSHWAVSRSVMAYLAPSGGHNLSFAYFSLVERASSFIGPIFWGLMVGGLTFAGGGEYRLTLALLSLFILAGLFFLARVKSDRAVQDNF